MKKINHKKIIELSDDFDAERESYILYQDELYQEINFQLLICKFVTVPLAMVNGFLICNIINLLIG